MADGGFDCTIAVSRGVNVLNEQLDNSDQVFKSKSGDDSLQSEVPFFTLDEFMSILEEELLSRPYDSSLGLPMWKPFHFRLRTMKLGIHQNNHPFLSITMITLSFEKAFYRLGVGWKTTSYPSGLEDLTRTRRR